MTEPVLNLVKRVREDRPGAVADLLAHARVKEIVRIRAHKVRAFPFERIVDRRQDAARAVWEVAASIDAAKAARLKTAGVTLAYLSTAVRNRMFRQLRTDLALKETTVTDAVGRKRFELVPKLVRGPFELALAQVDAMADPYKVVSERECVDEVQRAFVTAPMSWSARRVLRWRVGGMPGKQMCRLLGRSAPVVYDLLREARRAVRDQLVRIRSGLA